MKKGVDYPDQRCDLWSNSGQKIEFWDQNCGPWVLIDDGRGKRVGRLMKILSGFLFSCGGGIEVDCLVVNHGYSNCCAFGLSGVAKKKCQKKMTESSDIFHAQNQSSEFRARSSERPKSQRKAKLSMKMK